MSKFTLNDFVIIFNSKGVSLNGEDDNLGGIVLEGCEVEESHNVGETIGVREGKSGAYEVIKRLHFKESKK